jgi:hypothetical protein
MKWFKHFSSAHDGNSLTKVRMKFGAEGYAVYWYCLEMIAGDLGENGDATFELKHDAEVIAFNLKMDTLKVEEIMRYMVDLDMFGVQNGTITCLKLAKFIDKNFTRNKQIQNVIDVYNASQTVSDSLKTKSDSLRLSQGDEMRRDETRGDEIREEKEKIPKEERPLSGGDPPSLDPKKAFFDSGRDLLIGHGMTAKGAGGLLGRLRKAKGEDEAMAAVQAAADKSDPETYLGACCKKPIEERWKEAAI